jgi:hypothetical protein
VYQIGTKLHAVSCRAGERVNDALNGFAKMSYSTAIQSSATVSSVRTDPHLSRKRGELMLTQTATGPRPFAVLTSEHVASRRSTAKGYHTGLRSNRRRRCQFVNSQDWRIGTSHGSAPDTAVTE